MTTAKPRKPLGRPGGSNTQTINAAIVELARVSEAYGMIVEQVAGLANTQVQIISMVQKNGDYAGEAITAMADALTAFEERLFVIEAKLGIDARDVAPETEDSV